MVDTKNNIVGIQGVKIQDNNSEIVEKITLQPSGTLSVFSCEVEGRPIKVIQGMFPCNQIQVFSNDTNVRVANLKAPVCKDIFSTLTVVPDFMALKSKGITVMVKSGKILGKNLELEVRKVNGKYIDGVLDGGHTKAEIERALSLGVDLSKAFISVKIIEGDGLSNRDIAAISTALNKGSSPSEATLLEKKGLTSEMKKALKPEYVEKIEWVENSMLNVPHLSLSEFLMILNLMDAHTFGCFSYKRKTKMAKSIKKVVKGVSNETVSYDYLKPLMNDILELFDTIGTSFERLHGKGPNAVKDIDVVKGKYNITTKKKYSNGVHTLFTGDLVTQPVQKGFQYIILNALRAAIIDDEKGVRWAVPDICQFYLNHEVEIWNKVMSEIKSNIVDVKDDEGNVIGKTVDVSYVTKTARPIWENVYMTVYTAVLENRLNTGAEKRK